MKKLIIIVVLALGVFVLFSLKDEPKALNLTGSRASASEIVVTKPENGERVSSPIGLSGKARGTWYFEASAPVKVLDEDGTELGTSFVTAQGEWMTEEFVNFSGEVSYKTPKGKSGYVVFMNDNPSGDPERDKYLVVPVDFAN